MQGSRLIDLFEVLESKEIRELRKFIRSPFFNHRADVIQLFEWILTQLKIRNALLTKEAAFQELYPKQTYKPQQIRLVMSLLLKLIERFLIYQESIENESVQKTYLAKAYRKRKLDKHFLQTIDELHKKKRKAIIQNGEYYLESYQIEQESYLFNSLNKRTGEQNLQALFDALDVSYFAIKIRQACFSIAHQSVYKAKYNIVLLNEMLAYIKQQDHYINIPAIAIYYHGYLAFTETTESQHFQELKKSLSKWGDQFPTDEIRDLYLMTINFCIKQLNTGSLYFAQEGLDLYQIGLDQGFLLDQGVLSRFTYHNITAMALKLKNYKWVEKFLHQYKSKLDKKHRESTFSFNMARLAYEQKEYSLALSHLQQSDYKDFLLNISAKTLALKIYYELNELNLLDTHLHTMKMFIQRKKIIGYHRTNYLNIIRYTQKMISLNPFDKTERNDLIHKIKEEEILTERDWFLKELDQF